MSTVHTITTHSPSETKALGNTIGRSLKAGDVLALEGPLGSGKTTLVQGIARGLGVASEKQVSSPTYVLIHEYKGREKIYHLDWYRVKAVTGSDADMAMECFSSEAVTLVEWPERGRELLPPDTMRVSISHAGPVTRRLRLSFPKHRELEMQKALKKK